MKCKQCGKIHTRTARLILCICGNRIRGDEHSLGLGDIIATITHYTGIAWLTKRLTRGKCGCDKRQARLNTLGSRLYAKAMSLWSYRR